MNSLTEHQFADLLQRAEQEVARVEPSFYDQVMQVVEIFREKYKENGVSRALDFLISEKVITTDELVKVRRTVYRRLKTKGEG